MAKRSNDRSFNPIARNKEPNALTGRDRMDLIRMGIVKRSNPVPY